MEFNEDGTLKTPHAIETAEGWKCWRCNAPLESKDSRCKNCNPIEGEEFFCMSCEKLSKILLEDGMLLCGNCRVIKGVKR